jgi:hypothetical protein
MMAVAFIILAPTLLVLAAIALLWLALTLARYVLPVLVIAAAVAFVVLLCCSGCGVAEPEPRPFRAITGTELQRITAQELLRREQALLPIDGDSVQVLFVTTAAEQQAACHGYAACTSADGRQVSTYWPPDREPQWDYAYLLAHELCHVYYAQRDGDGDALHEHRSCYARPDAPQLYGDGAGIAWQVAQQF